MFYIGEAMLVYLYTEDSSKGIGSEPVRILIEEKFFGIIKKIISIEGKHFRQKDIKLKSLWKENGCNGTSYWAEFKVKYKKKDNPYSKNSSIVRTFKLEPILSCNKRSIAKFYFEVNT